MRASGRATPPPRRLAAGGGAGSFADQGDGGGEGSGDDVGVVGGEAELSDAVAVFVAAQGQVGAFAAGVFAVLQTLFFVLEVVTTTQPSAGLFQLVGGGVFGEGHEAGFDVGVRDPGDGPHFGVRQPACRERRGHQRHVVEAAGNADVFTGGGHPETAFPVEPVRGGHAFPVGPRLAAVELADQHQEPARRRRDVRGGRQDLRFEPFRRQRSHSIRRSNGVSAVVSSGVLNMHVSPSRGCDSHPQRPTSHRRSPNVSAETSDGACGCRPTDRRGHLMEPPRRPPPIGQLRLARSAATWS